MFVARTAGAVLALVGLASGALAQSPAVAPEPPMPPAGVTTSSSSSWTMSTSENGRTVSVSGKDGTITAEIDGKQVPADRIVHKGSLVQIKDDKGDILWESEVPGSDAVATISRGGAASRSISIAPRARGPHGGLAAGSSLGASAIAQIETPKVMIGIQMLEPDSSIRGHLGLKENESTMVGAIYEGLPAAQAGLEPYDVIVGVAGKSPAAPEAVRKALRETEPGKSVSFDVIHHGQKKTVTVTVEKYDGEKLEKAKVNAIAASSGLPSATAIAGMPGEDNNAPMSWSWSTGGGNPLVGTIPGQGGKPGKAITLWHNNAANSQEMAEQLRELAQHAKAQAEHAQAQAEQLREQMQFQGLSGGMGGFGPGNMDLNKLMEERMKRMEEMMQKMMEQRNAAPTAAPKKDDGKS